MDNDVIIIVLLALSALLLTAVLIFLIKILKGGSRDRDEKADNYFSTLMSALSELRRDGMAQNNAVVNTVNTSLNGISAKVEAMKESTSAQTLETVKALSEMREKLGESDRQQTKAVTEALDKIRESNEKKLDEMRTTVDEKLTDTLSGRLDSSFRTVSEQLQNVYKSLGEMKELSGGVAALNRVFMNVKSRGTWAEAQLGGILDNIIPGMYVRNYSPPSSRDVVEFAVTIPGADGTGTTYLPIDSKFPTEDYLRLCDAADAGDAEAVQNARKALESRVIAEARSISKYISPPDTTPFAVMYLATDSLYAEIISSKNGLADRLHNDYSVLVAGPSTVTALLSALAMGFRTVALNQKADEVMGLLAAAKSQYDKFGVSLQKAKKKIDEAGQSLDEAQRRNDDIVKKLRNVETAEIPAADVSYTEQ